MYMFKNGRIQNYAKIFSIHDMANVTVEFCNFFDKIW